MVERREMSNCSQYQESVGCSEINLIGVWVGVGIVSAFILIIVVLFALRCYFRGPTKGSNNHARLDDRTVVITGIAYGLYLCPTLKMHSLILTKHYNDL